ncbi:MAG: serine hydrolase [Magnetospiraceae bacterium]
MIDRIATWLFACLVLVMLVAAGALISAPAGAANSKYAAYVMEAETGKVLVQENATKLKPPASLTKMMTLFMVFDALENGTLTLKQELPVSDHASKQRPSKLGLKPGQTITVEQVILALVTKSANDAAAVVAEALGGTEYSFALKMTKRAHEIGMKRTQFRNASGLPVKNQWSTARDMATLARRLQTTHAKYYHYFSRTQFSFNGREYGNHNRLLRSYDGVDGLKTGYINASGYNLVASSTREGKRIIGVVFGGFTSSSRDVHMTKLLDRGFRKLGVKKTGVIETIRLAAPAKKYRQNRKAGSTLKARKADGTWIIQVGAFSSKSRAQSAALDAMRKANRHVLQGHIAVSTFRDASSQIMYRARIENLTKTQAGRACATLRSYGMACIKLGNGGEIAQAR